MQRIVAWNWSSAERSRQTGRPIGVAALTALLIAIPSAVDAQGNGAASLDIRAGLWQFVTRVDLDPPTTEARCVTREDARELLDPFRSEFAGCTGRTRTEAGATLVADLNCAAPNGAKSTLHVVLTVKGRETAEGTSSVTMKIPGMPEDQSSGRMTARRIGDCKR